MKIALVLFALALQTPAFAAKPTFRCPATKNKMEFKVISLFDGNPAKNVQLAPDNANSPFPHKWTLEKESLWATCDYGDPQKPMIKKRLSGKFTECETTESKARSGVYDALACK